MTAAEALARIEARRRVTAALEAEYEAGRVARRAQREEEVEALRALTVRLAETALDGQTAVLEEALGHPSKNVRDLAGSLLSVVHVLGE